MATNPLVAALQEGVALRHVEDVHDRSAPVIEPGVAGSTLPHLLVGASRFRFGVECGY